MFLLVFAVITIVSSWVAWRRNPLYSTRSTIRSVAIAGLAVAGLIALIVAAVNLTSGRSEAVVFTTMGAVILFGSLALIFIIQTLSTPKVAAIPLTVPLVHTHRRKIYKWLKRFAILVVVVALLGVIVPATAKIIILVVGGMAVFLGLILLPTQYLVSRNQDRTLTALQYAPWVHWQYAPDQWQEWIEVQVERVKAQPPGFIWKRDWRKFAWTIAFIAAGVFFFSPGSRLERTLYILAVSAFLFAIIALFTRDAIHIPERLRAKLLKASPEAWLGDEGVFCDDVLTPWLTVSNYLFSATIDQRQPASLLFRFQRIVPSGGGNQTVEIDQAVLIPTTSITTASDIGRLQHLLTAKCPKARITLC